MRLFILGICCTAFLCMCQGNIEGTRNVEGDENVENEGIRTNSRLVGEWSVDTFYTLNNGVRISAVENLKNTIWNLDVNGNFTTSDDPHEIGTWDIAGSDLSFHYREKVDNYKVKDFSGNSMLLYSVIEYLGETEIFLNRIGEEEL